MTAEQVIDEVKVSGLRGRGGADFPTAMKWSFVPKDHPGPKFIVVNADESEPGSAKDRYLMENSPHALIEGAAIASFAIGAPPAWVYIPRADHPIRGRRKARGRGRCTWRGNAQKPGNSETVMGVRYRDITEGPGGGMFPGGKWKVSGRGGSPAKVPPASMIDTSTDLDGLK